MRRERTLTITQLERLIAELRKMRVEDPTPFGSVVAQSNNAFLDGLVAKLEPLPGCSVKRFKELQFDALGEAFGIFLKKRPASVEEARDLFFSWNEHMRNSSYMHYVYEPGNNLIDAQGALRNTEYCTRKVEIDDEFRRRAAASPVPIDATREIEEFEFFTKLTALSFYFGSATVKMEDQFKPQQVAPPTQRALPPGPPPEKEQEKEGNYREALRKVVPSSENRFLNRDGIRAVCEELRNLQVRCPRTELGKQANLIIDTYIDTMIEELNRPPMLLYISNFAHLQAVCAAAAYAKLPKHEKSKEGVNAAIEHYSEKIDKGAFSGFLEHKGMVPNGIFKGDAYMRKRTSLVKQFTKQAGPAGVDTAQEVKDLETFLLLTTLPTVQDAAAKVFEKHLNPLQRGKGRG